jgi:hypothetical protein
MRQQRIDDQGADVRHRGASIGIFGAILVGFLAGCGSSAVPIPFLVDQRMELQDGCVTDFSSEEGICLRIAQDGTVSEDCEKTERACVGHFYITEKRGLPFFIHVNAAYPCYPDWLIERYSDPDSEFSQHPDYRVVSMELANYVTDDIVQLLEILKRSDLQSGETCYYRLEAGIDDLIRGEYGLKLWNPDRVLILETIFER